MVAVLAALSYALLYAEAPRPKGPHGTPWGPLVLTMPPGSPMNI